MTTTDKKKRRRLQTILIVAATLGCSSTMLGGTLAAITLESRAAQTGVA